MTNKTVIAAAFLAVMGSPILAQGVTGGTLGIEYMGPVDGSDFGGTAYSGGIEYAITRQFSVSLDLSSYSIDAFETNPSSLTLHGIYHMDDAASLGLFFGQDRRSDDATAEFFGVEGGTEFMGGEVVAFAAKLDSDINGTLLGVEGAYDWRDGIGFNGSAEMASVNGNKTNVFAVGGTYAMADGPEFFGEIGTVSVDGLGVTDSQAFIGLGARINFGAQRGTTFDARGIYEIIPGF